MYVRVLMRKAEVAELLLGAARRLGETMDPERVYGRFHDLLRDVVAHDAVVVSSYDERDGLIRCDYAWVEGNLLDPQIFPPIALNREGGGMQSRVIVSGEPLLANDVEQRVQSGSGTYYDVDREGNVRKLPESGPPGTKAVMMVPVEQEGQVVGVVQLMSDHDRYDTRDLEVFEGLVAQMAAAVRNARLQRERLRLEAAEAAARAVAAERELAAHVLDVVGDGIFLVDGKGTIELWNRAAAAVRRAAGVERDPGARPRGGRRLRRAFGHPPGGGGRPRPLALVRRGARRGRRRLHVPGPDRRAPARRGEERLHRHGLARAAHADGGGLRRRTDASAARRRARARAEAEAARDDRHPGRALDADHGGGAARDADRSRRAARRAGARGRGRARALDGGGDRAAARAGHGRGRRRRRRRGGW